MKTTSLALVAALLLCQPVRLDADLVTMIPAPFFPTGANVNTLAGPLFGSDFDEFDIPGPGMGFVGSSLLGNTALHAWSLKLDYTPGVAFMDSTWSGFGRTATDTHRATAESIFHFMVATPTAWSISGMLSVTDATGTTIPGAVELESELATLTSFSLPPSIVFYSYQVSTSTIDQTFMVGGMAGDSTNVLVGSPAGMLIPGTIYRLRTLATINALATTNGAATATGGHTIVFSAPPVPEPGGGMTVFLAACLATTGRRPIIRAACRS